MSDSSERFLVTINGEDLERLERMAKRQRISRNRYVVMAVLRALKEEPIECPICGRTEDHAH